MSTSLIKGDGDNANIVNLLVYTALLSSLTEEENTTN